MKMLALLFCLLLGLIGCVSVKPVGLYKYHSFAPDNEQHFQFISLYIDKEFTASDKIVIDQVIKEWNYALNGYLKIQIVSDKLDHDNKAGLKELVKKIAPTGEGVLMFKLNHDHEMLNGREDEEESHKLAFVNGLGDRGHLFVVIGDTIGTKNLHKILLHEFGHLMGAGHIDAHSLMYPYYGNKQSDCIDRFTLLLIADNRNLDINHLNYCSTKQFP